MHSISKIFSEKGVALHNLTSIKDAFKFLEKSFLGIQEYIALDCVDI